jgi:hypothetical protein
MLGGMRSSTKVVADEDRLVDPYLVEPAEEVAGLRLDGDVGAKALGPGPAVAHHLPGQKPGAWNERHDPSP